MQSLNLSLGPSYPINIGEAAQISKVSAKLIRHYESIGLIPKAARSTSGYRTYTEADVNLLTFVKRARGMGFSMKEIKKLVGLWKNKNRNSADVKMLTLKHIQTMENKIAELQDLVQTLKSLSKTCHGDHRAECSILNDFAKH